MTPNTRCSFRSPSHVPSVTLCFRISIVYAIYNFETQSHRGHERKLFLG